MVGNTQHDTCTCAYSGGYKWGIQNATTHISCREGQMQPHRKPWLMWTVSWQCSDQHRLATSLDTEGQE